MSLVKVLTVESQENTKIFENIEIFFDNLNSPLWLKKYVFWELNLLKFVGYDLSLENIVSTEISGIKKNYFVKSNSTIKNVPNFLIEKNDEKTDSESLLLGLKLVTDYLYKSILKTNNINLPDSRINFINILK